MSTPAPTRRVRSAVIVGACVVVIAILYVIVVALYAQSGQVGEAEKVRPDGVHAQLQIQPQSMDALGNRMTATIELLSGGPLDPDDTSVLDGTLEVLVTGTDGSRTLTFPAQQVVSPVSVRFIAGGEIEVWPFDAYEVQTTVVAYRTVDDAFQSVPTQVVVAGHIPGWTLTAEEKDLGAEVSGETGVHPVKTVVITAHRAGATIGFGIVLLVLMVAMPVLVLIVAITVFRGRRKVEASFMSWMGAMLFATIPLRTFLPGSPPIGSWVDFTVVLWVIAGLIVGLAIYVAAWLRHSPAPAEPAVSAAAVPAAAVPAVEPTAAVPAPVSADVGDPPAGPNGPGSPV